MPSGELRKAERRRRPLTLALKRVVVRWDFQVAVGRAFQAEKAANKNYGDGSLLSGSGAWERGKGWNVVAVSCSMTAG